MLILVGGVVRSTGSGMGCPDWPKCFGNWIPPTSVDELPQNYKEFYADYRHRKNERFARYLTLIGFEETGQQLLSDESVQEEATFNVTKTWIEYINRLVGVVIGFLIFAVAVFSLRYRKTHLSVTTIAVLCFLLVGFQGWFGSIVVSTNLTPWTITLHMFLALLIVVLLVYLVQTSRQQNSWVINPLPVGWVLACMSVLFIQILIGTRVREEVDKLAGALARSEWVANLGIDFFLHRSFSWVVLIIHVGFALKLVKTQSSKAFSLTLILLILGTILSGAGMAYLAVPPYLQPVHLLLATVTFGMLAYLLFEVTKVNRTILSR